MSENYRRDPRPERAERPTPVEESNEEKRDQRPVRKPKMITMKVTNASRVNVREDADVDSDVVTILNKDAIVKVDPAFEHPKFFKVRIGNDTQGFIMKEYLVEA